VLREEGVEKEDAARGPRAPTLNMLWRRRRVVVVVVVPVLMVVLKMSRVEGKE
jgi:hypothetical protein